jgi:sarcosine oxidase subunit gamma
MADLTTLRRSPLAGMASLIDSDPAAADAAVRLTERPFLGMLSVRVDPGSGIAAAIEGVLGAPLPRSCGEVTHHGPQTVLWLGPDEWLVVTEGSAEALAEDLRSAVSGGHAAIVDVSANRTVLELTGAAARDVLEKGCPVDLHPRSFGDDTAISTMVGRTPVVLWKVDATQYLLLPRPSFATYLVSWLLDAMREFAPQVRESGGT